MNLDQIQAALRDASLDGWLFYDHHHRDPIAARILGLDPQAHITRRWYYFIPASGEPRKLVHRIEQGRLDALPGAKTQYSSWQELHAGLENLLQNQKKIAMQYSPNNDIMYVSMVDAGTVEFLRSLGKEIVTSADLVSQFEAVLSEEQIASHQAAQRAIDAIVAEAWLEIGRRLRPASAAQQRGGVTEYDIVAWLGEAMRREGLVWENGPDVSVNANTSDSHYEPTAERSAPIREGDFLLIDIWGRHEQTGQHLLRHHVDRRDRPRAERQRTAGLRDRAQRARRRHRCGRIRIRRRARNPRLRGRRCGARRDPCGRLRANISRIAPDTTSPSNCTVPERISTTSKPTTSAAFCPTPASRSSLGFICPSSACAAK